MWETGGPFYRLLIRLDFPAPVVLTMEHTAPDTAMRLLASSKKRCDQEVETVLMNVAPFLERLEIDYKPGRPDDLEVTPSIGPQEPISDHPRSLGQATFLKEHPAQSALRAVLDVGKEMMDTALEKFLTDPIACHYFLTKICDLGREWHSNSQWPGRDWYYRILLAVSGFSRAAKWYHVDQYPQNPLGTDEGKPWSFFVSKASRWYYKDSKGKIHGSWKASLMNTWNRNGLLPPNLAVRKEGDSDYTLLGDLRLNSTHPSHPFRDSAATDAPQSIKDFVSIRTLHRGPSTSVFLAKRMATNDLFAVKVLEKPEMFAKNKVTIIRAERMAIFNQTDSHFISKVHFAFQSKTKVYLVKELFARGDCAALISSLGQIGEDLARKYTTQIVRGLEHLHQQGIIHRDLRPENILVDDRNTLKLTDFGISQKAFLNRSIANKSEETKQQVFRTIYYLTPEAVLGLQEDNASIDWWALGITTYEFLYGATPFQAEKLELVFQKILSGEIDWRWSTAPSMVARDFIHSMLHPDARQRCSLRGAEGVEAHRFLSNTPQDGLTSESSSARGTATKAKSHRLGADLRKHPLEPPTDIGPPTSRPVSPGRRSLSRTFTGLKSPKQSSRASSMEISSTRRPRSRSGRSTSRRRNSSRNSSDGWGSSWLSGYTTTESDPESDVSSLNSPNPSMRSSQWDWNILSDNPSSTHLLLEDLDLTGKITELDRYPFESGSLADVYSGTMKSFKFPVAVKIFRRMHSDAETLKQTSKYLCQEARIWRQLEHPNILPFLGISLDLGRSPALISPLCASGSIMKYLQHNKRNTEEKLQMPVYRQSVSLMAWPIYTQRE
ncbi:kinase-like domain-containing protein [Mycena maculata]|uniref:non-specific serine/threonine protein kinase n=1 Tax=Mycena maculata TaxID=230809 RepID=A0AAD7J8R9_9AGAR|nr:kinase-like domain-containing protein [Mycena maculata]